MPYNPNIHHRHSIRLKDYDYSQPGSYFVTICADHQKCIFGTIRNAEMHLNDIGRIVAQEWQRTGLLRPDIVLDEWVVMPNHFHAIVHITTRNFPYDTSRSAQFGHPIAQSLSSIIASFKSSATREIRRHCKSDLAVWQRNFWDHIIRHPRAHSSIRNYIRNNPARWQRDRFRKY